MVSTLRDNVLLHRFGSLGFVHDLSGAGGLHTDARWNVKGTRVLYTAESRLLALAEYAHGRKPLSNMLVQEHGYIQLVAPLGISVLEVRQADLPRGWRSMPHPSITSHYGAAWVRGQFSCLLRVPTARKGKGWCYVINPQHPEFVHIGATAIITVPYTITLDLLDAAVKKHG